MVDFSFTILNLVRFLYEILSLSYEMLFPGFEILLLLVTNGNLIVIYIVAIVLCYILNMGMKNALHRSILLLNWFCSYFLNVGQTPTIFGIFYELTNEPY